jgi:alpha-methylacyl-CoA racemase
LEPKFWSGFCKAIGRSDLIALQFLDSEEELTRVKAQVQSVLSQRSSDEWREVFTKHDCCVELISLPEGNGARDQQLRARGVDLIINFEDPNERLLCPKTPLRMTGVTPSTQRGPALGEHNKEILDGLKKKKIQSKL